MSDLPIQSKQKSEYSEKYSDHAFEQYKIYIEMADRISSRRQSANTFFLSINTILVTLSGYAKSTTSVDTFFYFITSLAGVLICYIWYRLVLSYKNLNSAKFKVIHSIEKELPFKLYDAEWEAIGKGQDKNLYHPFTRLEMRIPWIFFGIYILIIMYIIPWKQLIPNCLQ